MYFLPVDVKDQVKNVTYLNLIGLVYLRHHGLKPEIIFYIINSWGNTRFSNKDHHPFLLSKAAEWFDDKN